MLKIHFFASLRERTGHATLTDTGPLPCSAAVLWERLQTQFDAPIAQDAVMVAVNQHYTDWQHALQDGDEVAFFPPVTGG